MSDYDAMLAALDANIADIATFAAAGNAFNPVIAAAMAYARASVEVEGADPGIAWMDATRRKNAAFEVLRDAVVAKAAAQ